MKRRGYSVNKLSKRLSDFWFICSKYFSLYLHFDLENLE